MRRMNFPALGLRFEARKSDESQVTSDEKQEGTNTRTYEDLWQGVRAQVILELTAES